MPAIKHLVPLLVLLTAGCQTLEKPMPTKSKLMLDTYISEHLDKDKKEETKGLLPHPESVPKQEPHKPVKLIDVAASNVRAQTFFSGLVKDTGLNVIIHPNVEGRITLSLQQVPLETALQAIVDMYGYNLEIKDKILYVYPAEIRTAIIPVNYLFMKRRGISLTSVNSGRISDGDSDSDNNNSNSSSSGGDKTNGTFIDSRTETDFWLELQQTLDVIVGTDDKRKRVVVAPQAGMVSVHAYPHEIRNVKNFLNQSIRQLKRQVILETKIMEVTLADGFQQGIEWSKLNGKDSIKNHQITTSGSTSPSVSFGDQITDVLGGVASFTIEGTDFKAAINLMSSQGDVEILSSPRITATNNQKAVIKVGQDEYFVTKVSSTTVASDTPVTTPDVELTPFFSGIALDVTTQIDAQKRVLLHVHPSVIDVKEQLKTIKLSSDVIELPLATSQIRESDTVIEAKSGEIVVIGGLMKTENRTIVSKVPFLGDIPLLGVLFQNKSIQKVKTELVILLKPTVIERDTWHNELQRTRTALEDWYPKQTGLTSFNAAR